MKERRESINGISDRVSGLEADMQNLARHVDRMAKSIEVLGDRIQESARTPWNTLGTWAGVIISFMGFIGYMALKPVTENMLLNSQKLYTFQRDVNDWRHKHDTEVGAVNAKQSEQIRNLDEKIENIRQEQSRRTDRVYQGR